MMNSRGYIKSSSRTPDISVILPTHNRPHLLKEALTSLCEQQGSSFEVIVINDAGCDVTAVVNKFSSRLDLRYVSLSQNRGLPAARNVGVRVARGRYLAYLDDDDRYLLDRVAQRIALQQHAQVEDLVDLGGAQAGDERAAVRLDHHQTLGLQLAERLAHRDAADAELGRQLLLPQRRPRCPAPVVQRAPQGAGDGIGGGGGWGDGFHVSMDLWIHSSAARSPGVASLVCGVVHAVRTRRVEAQGALIR